MKNSPPVADRVLIIRLGALGDVVRTLPAVASLRTLYPGSHLTWLVEPAAAGAVEAAGLVDEVLTFPRGALVEALREGDALLLLRRIRRFLRILRERRFELSIDFHGLLKSGLLAWLSGAPVRYGYSSGAAREGAAIFANRRTGPLSARLSRFDRNEALVGALGPEPTVQTRPLLVASALAQARLTARLRAAGREHSRGFVLLHPGSSAGARYKRYAPGAWSEVAKSLAASGFEVWIAAGPSRNERGLAEEVVRRAGGALVLAPETRSFEDLLALQARAAVFVAADSGPLHAASLARVPVVQLVGPTDPAQNAPWRGAPSRRLRVPLPCSPCRRGCADPACMRAIPPGSVADSARELFQASCEAGESRGSGSDPSPLGPGS